MSQIGTMLTGAAVVTVIADQSQCEEYLTIGAVDTANILQGLTVEVDGVPFYNISNSLPIMGAIAKFLQNTVGSTIGLAFRVATGRISRNTTYRLTNSGATTPAIFATSTNQTGIPLIAALKTVLQTSFDDFEKFSALFLSVPANIASLEFSFTNGTKSTMSIQEAAALFNSKNPTEASGFLNAVLVIDNRDQSLQNVRVNTLATAVTVAIMKLPDASFQALKR